MARRGVLNVPVVLSGAACALFKDGEKILFLERALPDRKGVELWLPGCVLESGADPCAKLSATVKEQLGLDAQIGEVVRQEKFNAGSRKNKRLVSLLVFKASAKSFSACKIGGGFSGFKWLYPAQARQARLGKNALWV